MKKTLSIILALIMVLSLIPVFSASAATVIETGECGVDATYELYDNGHLIISGTGKIAPEAFMNNKSIKKLTVEQGITDIDFDTFRDCSNLKEAELPDSIKIISYYSFCDCSSLEEINIPENVEEFYEGAFASCSSLKKIRLPETLGTVGDGAFYGCTSLQYITILNPACDICDFDYTIIEQAKIYGYAGSTAESYAKKYNRTFITIEENKVYPVEVPEKPASELFHGNIAHYECAVTGKVFSDSEGKNEITKESVIIHNEIAVPAKAATCTEKGHTEGIICSVCGKLITAVPTEINPEVHTPAEPIYVPVTESTCTVKGHGDKYIYCKDCGKEISRDINIELPLAPHVVSEWTVDKEETDTEEGLKQGVCTVCGETVTEAIPVYKEKGQCGDNAEYKLYPDGHLIISGTGAIENSAFKENESIKKLTVEQGITDTGRYSFDSCTNITEVKLPDSIKIIAACSFGYCPSLETINIPDNTETIYKSALCMTSLKKIKLPEKVNTVDDWAFCDCASLQYITILNPACDIFDSEDTIPEQAKIYGYAGSTAESYATKYNRTFIPIEDNKFYPVEISAAETTDEKHGTIKYYECAVTGKLFSDIECTNEITIEDTVTHNTRYIIPGKAATCTETGLTEGRRCSVCGKITVPQEVIPAAGHTEEILPAVAPTCTKTGLTEGKKCSVCGEILVPQTVIEAAGHTEEILPAVAPTCTETGLTEGKKCSVCGEILVAQTAVEASGHKDENKDGKCDVCGEQLTAPEVKPDCKHMCHSENRFVQFIWKIVNFFNKLFKINQYCECGARHW